MIKKISCYSLLTLLLLFIITANAEESTDLSNQECIEHTSSQVQLDGLHLHIPYALANGTYYHADFEFIGDVNEELKWQLSNAVEANTPLPSPCISTVNITGNKVFLADIVAMQNSVFTETHYSANLILDSNNDGLFLSLIDYSQLDKTSAISKEIILILAVAGSEKDITLAWDVKDSATIDKTYHIHASNDANFQPDVSTLIKTVQGLRQTELTDLIPGTEYFIIIIAENANGDQIAVSNTLSARTFDKPVILNTSATLEQSEELNLGNPDIVAGNNISFILDTGDEIIPGQGNILVGKTSDGGYLRKIENVTQTNGELHLVTSNASMSDIFDAGSLSSSILLANISENAQAGGKSIKRFRTANASQVSQIKWDDDLLEITQTNHAYHDDELSVTPLSNGRSFKLDIDTEIRKKSRSLTHQLSSEVSIDASIDFEPTFETEVDWSFGSLNSAKVKATGNLTVALEADFEFKGKVNYVSPKKRILTKSFKARYLIGGIPVWQITTFTLDAQVTANAESAVVAGSEATTSAKVSLGATYANDSWSTFSSPIKLQNTIITDIGVKGKINAEVRLIPNIEARFYETTSANLSVEPFLDGKIAAESISDVDFVNKLFPGFITQMTDFDVDLGLECFMSANFKFVIKEFTQSLLDRTKICGEGTFTGAIEYPLFSLPELDVTAEQKDNLVFANAKVEDGINNLFDESSMEWFVVPEGPILNSSGKTMSFTPDPGIEAYQIFFSGHGRLGSIARQFVQSKITVVGIDENGGVVEGDGTGGAGGTGRDKVTFVFDAEAQIFTGASQTETTCNWLGSAEITMTIDFVDMRITQNEVWSMVRVGCLEPGSSGQFVPSNQSEDPFEVERSYPLIVEGDRFEGRQGEVLPLASFGVLRTEGTIDSDNGLTWADYINSSPADWLPGGRLTNTTIESSKIIGAFSLTIQDIENNQMIHLNGGFEVPF